MQLLAPFAMLYEEGSGWINALAFSRQGLLAVTGLGTDIWDLSLGIIPEALLASFGGISEGTGLVADGSLLALSQEKCVVVLQVPTLSSVQQHHHTTAVQLVSWSPDGRMIASCSQTGQYHVWSVETGEVLARHHFGTPPSFLDWLSDVTGGI